MLTSRGLDLNPVIMDTSHYWATIMWMFASFPGIIQSFNLDITEPIVFKGSPKSYFGYSIAMHSNTGGKWLLVGAPLANSTHQPLESTGAMFKCGLPHGYCTEVPVDDKGNELDKPLQLLNSRLLERKQGMWLGGSIAANSEGSGSVVVCSPLYIAGIRDTKKEKDYFLNGLCYMMDGDLQPKSSLMPSMRYLSDIASEYDIDFYVLDYGMGNLGMSSHITQDGSRLILGAPGFFDWKGGLVHYDISTLQHTISTEESLDHLAGTDFKGYSSISMHLQPRLTHYVVGAPRANGKGCVYVYRGTFQKELKLDGTQIGSYFGSALCALDFNGDGLDDLLVGAPLYRNSLYDEGLVYVFINRQGRILEDLKQPLSGLDKPGSRFGSAISSPGDLNDDSFADVVIGAPFEDGGVGAVYVYLGDRYGIQTPFAQRLAAKDFRIGLSGVRGFGYSITTGLDVDENHYNDVGIGAYGSDLAMVFRVLPVVKLKASLKISGSPAKQGTVYSKDSSGYYKACAVVVIIFTYEGRAVPDLISVAYNISHDMGTSKTSPQDKCTNTIDTESGLIPVQRLAQKKAEHSFLIQVRKLSVPVHFNLTFRLPYVTGKNRPVLDPAVQRIIHGKMSFAKDCEPGVITGMHEKDISHIVLGAPSQVSLIVPFNNKGKSECVTPRFVVTHADQVYYVNIKSTNPILANSVACVPLKSRKSVECEMVTLMPEDSSTDFIMTFDPQYAIEVKDTMTFELTTNSDTFLAAIPVRIDSKLDIKGLSHPGEAFFMTDDLTQGYPLSHNYTITNFGPGLAPMAKVILALPKEISEDQPIIINFTTPHIQQISGAITTAGSCQTYNGDKFVLNTTFSEESEMVNTSTSTTSLSLDCSEVDCLIQECSVANIFPQENIVISIQFFLNMTTMRSLEYSTIKMISVALLQGEDEGGIGEISDEVTTKLYFRSPPPPKPVPLWVIILGVSLGLALLVSLVVLLKKCGFFRRPQKEEMEHMVEVERNDDNDNMDKTRPNGDSEKLDRYSKMVEG